MKFTHLRKAFLSSFSTLAGLLCCLLLLSSGCRAVAPKGDPSGKPLTQTKLPEPLRSLSATHLPTQLKLKFSWTGVGGRVPDQLYQLKYLPLQKLYEVQHKMTGQSGKSSRSTLPAETIAAVFEALPAASWAATQEPVSVFTHTDDYPVYRLTFSVPPHQAVELFSSSSTPHAVPWNLSFDKKLYTTENQTLAEAAFQLFSQVKRASKLK